MLLFSLDFSEQSNRQLFILIRHYMSNAGQDLILNNKSILVQSRRERITSLNTHWVILISNNHQEWNTLSAKRWDVVISRRKNRNAVYVLRILESKSLNELSACRKSDYKFLGFDAVVIPSLIDGAENF